MNDLCDQYDSELSKVVDVYAPLKTRFVISRPSAPWYSEEIAAEKRKCRKLERCWCKSGTEADKLQYSDQCSRVRKLLKSSKMSYTLRLLMKINQIPEFYLTPWTVCCIVRLKTTIHPVALQRNYVISFLTSSATKL